MQYSDEQAKRLSYILIAWLVSLLIVFFIKLPQGLHVMLLLLLLGWGACLLGYMARLPLVIQVLFLLYATIAPIILYITYKPTSLRDIKVIVMYIPVLAYAVYSWMRRPRA